MFGDTMLVNGTVYPEVTVEARRYRLRILNACNARFLNLQLYVGNGGPEGITFNPDGTVGNAAGPDWLVLGTEAGFLQKPVPVQSDVEFSLDATTQVASGSLITGNAERWDVLVDFTGFANSQVILYNDAPAPFPGGDPRNDFINAAGTSPDTRQIMRFDVIPATGEPDAALTLVDSTGNWTVDPGIDPPLANVNPNGTYTLNVAKAPIRRLTLNETFDAYGRLAQLMGTDVAVTPGRFGKAYLDTPTEIVNNGDVEIWEILNLTADTHPIHFHLVNVQVLNREAFNALTYTGGAPVLTPGTLRGPEPTELGWKETVKMHPGEVTRVIMKFVVPPIKKSQRANRTDAPKPADRVQRVCLPLPYPRARGTRHDATSGCQVSAEAKRPGLGRKPRASAGLSSTGCIEGGAARCEKIACVNG